MEILGGPLYAVAGAGESHGPAVTTLVFGCPPGLKISRGQIQHYLDLRRPGGTKHGTTRREADRLLLLAGLFSEDETQLYGLSELEARREGEVATVQAYEEGWTTGEPIAALVLSTSTRSSDYKQFLGPKGEVRPGHTDLVKYFKSRGFVDPRGGGRSSYRSSISDVIGGSVARIFLREHFQTEFFSSICQVGPLKSARSLGLYLERLRDRIHPPQVSLEEVRKLHGLLGQADIRSLDTEFAQSAAELIRQARVDGDSLGAVVEVVAVNVPALVGEPLYNSLKLRLMGSLGGLHAVQSCEIGDGFEVVARRGSANNDPIRSTGYQKNSHGGLLGGVTTGMPLVARVGFKPTSSILKPQHSIRKNLEEIDFQLKKGRHDPCVGVRAGVALESRMAIELMNAVLWHQSHRLDHSQFELFK